MPDVARSSQFDDVYFSKKDGLAETQHVFLDGGDLPHAWVGKDNFTIFETGFGTGLNFFSAWKLFEETADNAQSLDFVSIEKYPLKPEEIREALAQWDEHFGGRIDSFLELYPLRIRGFHRIKITPQITLTLIFDDINEALPTITGAVDCWFLDGFMPSKNPDMWTQALYDNMTRLSKAGARVATFTAAGDVRRGLEGAGFDISKRDGFGYKREMLVGQYKAHEVVSQQPTQAIQSVAIIGAGLAGTAMAYTLKQYGFTVKIYEQADKVASGASGNDVGFYNPRFTAQADEVADFFAPAYSSLISLGKKYGDAFSFNPCGALHLINSPEKKKRFDKLVQNWQWDADHIRIIDGVEASDIAGIEIRDDCLHLPDAGSLCPRVLCAFYAQNIDIEYGIEIKDLDEIVADVIILCTASTIKNFEDARWLPVQAVRGQSSTIKATRLTDNLKCNLHYGGYLSASVNGEHATGATFQRWLDNCDVLEEDHGTNIQMLKECVPSLVDEDFEVTAGWAGLRTASQDRIPIVGQFLDTKNIYVSTAFGSYGILGTLTAAHYMADILRKSASDGVVCLPQNAQYALSPQHYVDRANKKGRVLL